MNQVFTLLICVAFGPVGLAQYGPPGAYGPYGPPRIPGYGPPVRASSPPTIAPSPSINDLNQAVLGVRSEVYMDNGNSIVGALAPPPFSALNGLNKQQGQEIYLRELNQQERYLERTANATPANREKLGDIQLNQMATQAQISRRGAQALPAPYNILAKPADAESRQDWLTLSQNQLFDAQQAYAKQPSYANWLAVRAARDGIAENRAAITGDHADIAAAILPGKGLNIIGPINRRKFSQIALQDEKRNNQQLQVAYAIKPTEDNWWNLRLSNVKLRALRADLAAEQGEVIANAGVVAGGLSGVVVGVAAQDVQFKNEEDAWKRLNQLTLANLLRKRAESAQQAQAAAAAKGQGPGSVPARMLALSSYGQPVLPPRSVPSHFAYGQAGR